MKIKMENLTVNCTPVASSGEQEDPNLSNEFVHNIDEANNTAEANLEEQCVTVENYFSSTIKEDYTESIPDDAQSVWIDAAIKLLLSLVEEMMPQVGKCVRLKTKKMMWSAISNKLREAGYHFTASQADSKYRSLERTYKKVKIHNSKPGNVRKTCPYERELNSMLSKKYSVFPQIMIGSHPDERNTKENYFSYTIEEDYSESLPDDTQSVWIDAATKLLLSLVEEMLPKVGKGVGLKTKKMMWAAISNKLCEAGYRFTAGQAENKYRGLERTYRNHNSKPDGDRKICAYESELHSILLKKDSVFPRSRKEDLLDAECSTEISDHELSLDTSRSANMDIESPVAKKGKLEQLMEILSKNAAARDRHYERMVRHMENIERHNEAMLKQQKKHNDQVLLELKEKNELLRGIFRRMK